MTNNGVRTGVNTVGFMVRLRNRFRSLFNKKLTEPFLEDAQEARWDQRYRDAVGVNFTEIFANRLTNYTLCGSFVECDEPAIEVALQKAVNKWHKWTQMAFGVGRVFLIPYSLNGVIYTDIIPQGRAWVTKIMGDDIHGIGVLADVRYIDKESFARITSYEWDADAKTFTIENKAVRDTGGEVPLAIIKEWECIEPYIVINGAEKPLFAFVDCPKDNRSTDRQEGAPITYGCDETINEICECFKQYAEEYDLKQTWLGLDRLMLDKNGNPDHGKLYKVFNGKSTDDLFEIFSPDIRDASYKARLLDLFARLEKQVGTSAGILTPAETVNATATQVRRSMYDTLAIVDRMRWSIETAIDDLCYIYTVLMDVNGLRYNKDYTVKKVWGQSMVTDSTETFSQALQAHAAGAVKDSELRMFVYPGETAEEAEEAVAEIKATRPEPMVPDFFGG